MKKILCKLYEKLEELAEDESKLGLFILWLINGNDCYKCKLLHSWRTAWDCDEYDCACDIRGMDFEDNPCYLIEPFKSIKGFWAKRRNSYYESHEYDGIVEFMEDLDKKDEKMKELIMSKVLKGYVVCMKYGDGTLHECNTELVVEHNAWEVRSGYEDFAHPVVHEKLSTEWKKLIKKTMRVFYNRTIGRIVPYIVG